MTGAVCVRYVNLLTFAQRPNCWYQVPLETVVFTKDSASPFDELVKGNFKFDKGLRAYFEDEELYQDVLHLLSFRCSLCDADPFPTMAALKKHAKERHRKFYWFFLGAILKSNRL